MENPDHYVESGLDAEIYGSYEKPLSIRKALSHYAQNGKDELYYYVHQEGRPAFRIKLNQSPDGVNIHAPRGIDFAVVMTTVKTLVARHDKNLSGVQELFDGKLSLTKRAFQAAANHDEHQGTSYGKEEIEPGVYRVTGVDGPGKEVNLNEVVEKLNEPLPPMANGEIPRTRYPNHADREYQKLLRTILDEGSRSGDRTGTGTIKSFGHQMRFNLQQGFPLLTSKRVWFEGVARELLWFLRGRSNIWYLLQNDVGIWTDNAYAAYKEELAEKGQDLLSKDEFEQAIKDSAEPATVGGMYSNFALLWGDMGRIYGPQWRDDEWFDQIANLVEQLQENPDSRRLRVSAWRPRIHMKGAPDEDQAVLPPCHTSFQCFTRELSVEERRELWFEQQEGETGRLPSGLEFDDPNQTEHDYFDQQDIPRRALSLRWEQRSVDTFLGLPFNIASYALLTHMLAERVNMMPEKLIFHGGDCHIYDNHREQVDELLSRVPMESLPSLSIDRDPPEDLADYEYEDFSIEGYDPHPSIQAPMAA